MSRAQPAVYLCTCCLLNLCCMQHVLGDVLSRKQSVRLVGRRCNRGHTVPVQLLGDKRLCCHALVDRVAVTHNRGMDGLIATAQCQLYYQYVADVEECWVDQCMCVQVFLPAHTTPQKPDRAHITGHHCILNPLRIQSAITVDTISGMASTAAGSSNDVWRLKIKTLEPAVYDVDVPANVRAAQALVGVLRSRM